MANIKRIYELVKILNNRINNVPYDGQIHIENPKGLYGIEKWQGGITLVQFVDDNFSTKTIKYYNSATRGYLKYMVAFLEGVLTGFDFSFELEGNGNENNL